MRLTRLPFPTSTLALALGALAACASPPRFYETRLIASEYDEANAATRVTVSFEVWDGSGRPISDIDADDLAVYENGVRATSESTLQLERMKHPIDVVLLLDRSASVRRDSGAGPNVRSMAQQIVDGLADQPCNVHLYSFANTVDELNGLDELGRTDGGDARSRWTALYHAVSTVLNEQGLMSQAAAARARENQAPRSPSTVVVICTDGADNYSHNHDLMTLADLERQVRENRIVIHSLGLGNVAAEQDRQGISGIDALRRLSVNGSFHFAEDDDAVPAVIEQVLRHVRATYSCVFVSPSITGEHELVLEVRHGDAVGRSQPIKFPTNAPRQAAPGPDR